MELLRLGSASGTSRIKAWGLMKLWGVSNSVLGGLGGMVRATLSPTVGWGGGGEGFSSA